MTLLAPVVPQLFSPEADDAAIEADEVPPSAALDALVPVSAPAAAEAEVDAPASTVTPAALADAIFARIGP